MKKLFLIIFAIFLLIPALNADYFVDFEEGGKPAYATGTVKLSELNWEMTEALTGSLANDKRNGTFSARMRRNVTTAGEMVMLEDKLDGIGTVSFYYAKYATETDQPGLTIQYSVNSGQDWINIGQIATYPDNLTLFTADINYPSKVRLRFITDLTGISQRRFNIDDILITDYFDTVPPEWGIPGISNITVVETYSTSVKLQWDAANDSFPVTYDIYGHTSAFTDTSVATIMATDLTDTETHIYNLNMDQEYYFRVLVKDIGDNKTLSDDYAYAKTILDLTGPDWTVPGISNITAIETHTSSVRLSWDEAIDDLNPPVTYEIYGHTEDFSDTVAATIIITNISNTEQLVEDLDHDTPYFFRVIARDSVENKTVSDDYVWVRTLSDTEPPDWAVTGISNITVIETYSTSLRLQWDEAEDLISPPVLYDIYGHTAEFTDTATASINVFNIDDMQTYVYELNPDTTYYFRVLAKDDLDNKRLSDDLVLVRTLLDTTPPDWTVSGISNINITGYTPNSMKIVWDAAIDEESPPVTYELYYDTETITNIDDATLAASNIFDTGFIVVGLSEGTTYYFRATAVNDIGLKLLSTDEAIGATPAFTSIQAIQQFDSTTGTSPLVGEYVWTKGIATIDSGLFLTVYGRTSVYIQDGDHGLNIYYGSSVIPISNGDTVVIYGKIAEYNGLTQIEPDSPDHVFTKPSGTIIEPKLTPTSIDTVWQNAEEIEGTLVQFFGTVVDKWTTGGGNPAQNLRIRDNDDSRIGTNGLAIRWENNNPEISKIVANINIGDQITITGVIGQNDTTSPYTSGYQIFPRYDSDFIMHNITISGKVVAPNADWTVKEDLAGIEVNLIKKNDYKRLDDLLSSVDIIDTRITNAIGEFVFSNLQEGATYIVFPSLEDDGYAPFLAQYAYPGLTTESYPVFKDIKTSVTDVMINMVDPVLMVTLDNTVCTTSVTLHWEIYSGNALHTTPWVIPDVANINYLLVFYRDGEEDPYHWAMTEVGASSFTDTFNIPGKYRWRIIADSYNHPGVGETIPITISSYDRHFIVKIGEPPAISSLSIVDNKTLLVRFTEEVTIPTAENVTNYSVTPGSITPFSATRTNTDTVTLVFSDEFTPGDYTLTIEGVKDTSGNDIAHGIKNTETFKILSPGLSKIAVFPNPARINLNQNMTFKNIGTSGEIMIYDVSGNLKMKMEYDADPFVFDVSELSSGIYFYVVESDGDRVIGKFAIIR